MRQVLVIALIASLTPCLVMAAEIYRWTDEAGNTHYSENPPQGVDAQPMNIQTRSPKPANSDNSQAKSGSGADNQGGASGEAGDGNEKAEEGKQPDSKAVAEARRENCEAAREALEMLENNARVQVEEDGERRYLSQEEMEAERERYEEIRDENCK